MQDDRPYVTVPSRGAPSQPGLTTLQKAELIRGVEVFSRASVEELFRLASLVAEVQLGGGEVVLRENDIAVGFYVVVQGKVELASGDGGTRKVIGTRGSFGLHSVLTREPLAFTATALQDTLALSIGAEDLFNLLSTDVEIMVSLFRYFASKAGMNSRV